VIAIENRDLTMALTREARPKPEFRHLYPEASPEAWLPAETLARQVSDRVLARQGYAGLLRGRVLPESHFEFRGGPPGHIRPGGRLSRAIDGIR
jgi:hypothetical protein